MTDADEPVRSDEQPARSVFDKDFMVPAGGEPETEAPDTVVVSPALSEPRAEALGANGGAAAGAAGVQDPAVAAPLANVPANVAAPDPIVPAPAPVPAAGNDDPGRAVAMRTDADQAAYEAAQVLDGM